MKLVADIGGTHARFALLDALGAPAQLQNLKTSDFSDLTAAMRAYLKTVHFERVDGFVGALSAVISIAAPLAGDRIRMTNAAWDFSSQQTQIDLGFQSLRVINDFEALALAVPTLTTSELQAIGHGLPLDGAQTKAIIGPGTGLGMAGVMPVFANGGSTWHAIPCEGGHASFAPHNAREAALLQAAWGFGSAAVVPHLCWEDFVSGTGLPLLHRAVCAVDGWGYEQLTPPHITQAACDAKAEHHSAARATLNTFCAMMGSAAGDLALMLGARGGVYIKGGVLDRVLELDPAFLIHSDFRQRFEAKGEYSRYLHTIPTWFITTPQLALRGCATLHPIDTPK